MKILNQNSIYSVYANSTKVFANNTYVYANTTTGLNFAENIHLVPRKAEYLINVQIKDELKDLIVDGTGYLDKEKESYTLSVVSFFPFVNDNQFELKLTSQIDDVVIYRGKMLVTNQQPQKFKYYNEE